MDEEELPTYNEKVDVWSVGALTFEALTGFQPFLADGAADLAALVAARLAARDADSDLPAFIARAPGLSAECRDFVARCLEADPAARPAAAELLAHPWITRRVSFVAGDDAEGAPAWSEDRMSRCLSDTAPRVSRPPSACDAGPGSDGGAPPAAPSARRGTSSAGGGSRAPVRRSLSASAADMDLTRPSRSKTGRLEGSRAAAAAAGVGT
jgi:serine/threonine protein kinase